MSQLIQIYLPLADNDGNRFPRQSFTAVEATLTEHFEGFTAFSRAPAAGAWQSPDEGVQRDDIVVYEVIVASLDAEWWSNYRKQLEHEFQQTRILIRAHQVQLL